MLYPIEVQNIERHANKALLHRDIQEIFNQHLLPGTLYATMLLTISVAR